MDNFWLGYGVCESVRFFPTSANLQMLFVHVAQFLMEKRKLTYLDKFSDSSSRRSGSSFASSSFFVLFFVFSWISL